MDEIKRRKLSKEERLQIYDRCIRRCAYCGCDIEYKEKPRWEYTNNFPIGHGEKSVIQIMRYIYLTEEEVLAIRWHMGAFDYSTKGGNYDMNYAFAESRLAAMLHIADMMATHLDERKVKTDETA